jgi:hypothetical protein
MSDGRRNRIAVLQGTVVGTLHVGEFREPHRVIYRPTWTFEIEIGIGTAMGDDITEAVSGCTGIIGRTTRDMPELRRLLRIAGLLTAPTPMSGRRPSPAAVVAAGSRAARGRPVSDFVFDGR